MKCDDKTHMSLFFDKKIGFIPSNEDALKNIRFTINVIKLQKKNMNIKRIHGPKKIQINYLKLLILH